PGDAATPAAAGDFAMSRGFAPNRAAVVTTGLGLQPGGGLPERALGPARARDREAPDVEHPLQPPVGRRIVRCLHRLVVLAEELNALSLREVPEYHQRIPLAF